MSEGMTLIECAHVQGGARTLETIDLGDLTGTPRIVALCRLCSQALRGRILSGELHRALHQTLVHGVMAGPGTWRTEV